MCTKIKLFAWVSPTGCGEGNTAYEAYRNKGNIKWSEVEIKNT